MYIQLANGPTVSIHPILLLIGEASPTEAINQSFNTSYITINQKAEDAKWKRKQVSIHPILLLISNLYSGKSPAYGSFNTSYITINQLQGKRWNASKNRFNTSYITINPDSFFTFWENEGFQYILYYY